jgi:cytochrome oxidase Cu insertion factor (SCO1/SenC/PrrC family)
MSKLHRSAVVIFIVGLLLLVAALAIYFLRSYQFHGLVLESSQPAPDFILTGPGGKPVNLSDFRGKMVDHTATISVLDRQGRLQLVWPFGTEWDAMAADLEQMLR